MVKEKVLDLANKISGTVRGAADEVKPEHPEYRALEPVISEEMAEVALHLQVNNPMTAGEVAESIGRPVEEIKQILWDLAIAGGAFVNTIDGEDKYWLDVWVPGHMEILNNHPNKESIENFEQIAQAFDDYGKRRAPMAAGNIPMGLGPMRTIPIEQAISGETKRASYEEISKYLNENTIFSVSDCSCRTSREAIGEGCGHLKEDMCIQLGHAAEYYIRTGRGRKITREEAFEIIKRAEENGLMHNIPNMDGKGKTHAICNCCGCSCFVLRNASMFINPDMVRSNYVSQVDKEKCVACGECVQTCPTNSLKLGQKLCTEKPLVVEERVDFPSNTEWLPERWNRDYRINRKNVIDTGTSPCIANCPAHISIQGYIKLASQGRYKEALQLIKNENPFPAVCGRICPRSCESACTRGDIDDAVAIDEIKKFIAEQDLNAENRFIPRIKHEYTKKVAVVGAGPSGLSCAYFLAVEGYKVTVFEKQNVLGGMLTLGIPSYRLEKDVINSEIEVLRELGVEFKNGVEVGADVTLSDLRKEGYEGFYLAIGAQNGRKLNIEGEDAKNVVLGVDFLREVNLGNTVKMDGKVLVIGGGNVAIDVARTAARVGASKVDMFCLESLEEMPALEEEIEEALGEGVLINNSWGPKRIISENQKVVGVEFKKCISVFDKDGKFNPQYDENQTQIIEADHVLISVGQSINWGQLLSESKVEINPNMTVKADAVTLQTAEPDVFSGGDVLTGPKFAIDAIAMGKEAAISIHRYVNEGQNLLFGRDTRQYSELDKENIVVESYDNMPRQRSLNLEEKAATESFNDSRATFTEDQVQKETERCLSCGATTTDEFMCVGCGACTVRCKFEAISLVRKYDAENPEREMFKPLIGKHVMERREKIAARNKEKESGN